MRTRRALWQITVAHACRHMRIVMRACVRVSVRECTPCAIVQSTPRAKLKAQVKMNPTNTQTHKRAPSGGRQASLGAAAAVAAAPS